MKKGFRDRKAALTMVEENYLKTIKVCQDEADNKLVNKIKGNKL